MRLLFLTLTERYPSPRHQPRPTRHQVHRVSDLCLLRVCYFNCPTPSPRNIHTHSLRTELSGCLATALLVCLYVMAGVLNKISQQGLHFKHQTVFQDVLCEITWLMNTFLLLWEDLLPGNKVETENTFKEHYLWVCITKTALLKTRHMVHVGMCWPDIQGARAVPIIFF